MEQIGKDIYFDLVDYDKVRSFRIQKQMPFNFFKVQFSMVTEELLSVLLLTFMISFSLPLSVFIVSYFYWPFDVSLRLFLVIGLDIKYYKKSIYGVITTDVAFNYRLKKVGHIIFANN